MADANGIQTLVVDNFQGRLSRYAEGDINSGYAKYTTTFGNDPFTVPGNLTWFEAPIQIDPSNQVITDLIMSARPRLESGITYVYAIGHTGRLYKIQVNDPTSYNPNYDNPVLLTTLVTESPTFKYGASIQFFGATEKIYIGHDKGVTSVNFDGAGEAFVGVVGSWTQNVPRMAVNFIGSLFYTNGTNLAQIDSTATVTTYAKLSPAFPAGTQARDIDVSADGNYIQIVVARIPQPDMTLPTQDTTSLSSGDSYFMYWNGTDLAVTAYNPYLSYSINSNVSFGSFGYTMGYDLGGAAIYSGPTKIISLPSSNCPVPQALYSIGNLLGFASPEQAEDALRASLLVYGQYDEEIPQGLFRFFRQVALGRIPTNSTFPGTGANMTGVGSLAWTNPGNITADDSSYAVIDGNDFGETYSDTTVSIVRADGSVGSTNKAQAGAWSGTETVVSYGGTTDLWGETWTPADINDSDFGAVLSITRSFGDTSNYLRGSNFGFSIPSSATITGIQLDIKRVGIGGISPEARVNYFKITVYYTDTSLDNNVVQMPMCQVVSNLLLGASNSGYSGNQVGSAKLYYSTLSSDVDQIAGYQLYKFTTVPTGLGSAIGGVYETQSQIFSKKIKVGQVRVYVSPLVANNAFTIELIGSGNQVIENSGITFTVGTNADAGQDYLWYNPEIAPTYALGVRITNVGTTNMEFVKVELDYTLGGI